jgi:predicted dehydrogenase
VSKLYTDYDQAIQDFSPDIVYISLVNSLHAEWIEKSLNYNCHVIVDKPACLELAETERLLDLADNKQLCLAEALVYSSHTQIVSLLNEFSRENIKPKSIVCSFSFPSFSDDNFRNKAELGGGAIWDLGPYAVSIARVFFNSPLHSVSAILTSTHPQTGVETGFTILAKSQDARSVVGHFGFDTEYRNNLLVLAEGMNIEVDRIFTTPYDKANKLKVQCRGDYSEIEISPCNAPVVFLGNVISAINKKSWGQYSNAMLDDARALKLLCEALAK